MKNQFKRILQLTDLHLFGDQATKMIGINSHESLKLVMSLVEKSIEKKQPSLLALTGDISQDYSPESYKIAKNFFKDMLCPVIATMGNHEYPPLFRDFFGNPTQVFTLDNWNVLFLNSHWPEHVGGKLAPIEFDFLRKALDKSLKQHVIIFLHHPLLSVKSHWLDKIITNNSSKALEIIDQYKNIKAVFCGHVHQKAVITRHGVSYFSTPATSWQFATNSYEFKLDTLMPGFRYIDLYEDGTFKTEVVRIEYDAEFIPNLDSKGY